MNWRRATALATACAALLVVCAAATDRADAEVPLYGFDTTSSLTQAGGHPDIAVRAEFGTFATEGVEPCFCNAIKDLKVNMPAGVIGAPGNIVQCTATELSLGACPTDSQVGVVAVRLFAPLSVGGAYFVQPLYNMEARPGQLALFATPAPLVQLPIYTVVSARTESDYGLEFSTFGVPRLIPPNEITQFTWGVPADPIHDDLRWTTNSERKSASCQSSGGDPLPELYANEFPTADCNFGNPEGPNPAINPPTPFLLNPSECVGPLTATAQTIGYEHGVDNGEAPYPETTGCDQLSFNPSLSAKTTTTEADAPSGLDVNLKVPQFLSPTAPSPSAIKAARVTLPPGLAVDPNVADGKLSCSDQEAAFGTRAQGFCPEFSKIGSLTIESSSLPGPLPGSVYLGKPLPGNRYRVFLIADGFSLHIKLPGIVNPDPQTGQLRISLEDLPQTPFQEFDMHLFGAERGLLATPTHCGTYPVHSEFVPWNSALPNQTSTQFFTIDSGPGGTPCPPDVRPFTPALSAGVTDNTGGAHTSFALNLTRRDGDQTLSGLNVTLPAGFTAKLAGIAYCPESALAMAESGGALGVFELASPSCPALSQIGESSAEAGAGTRPVALPGRVYLAGPYKGAPLSLAVVTPAVVGPYDLGNVVVRAALRVDPTDAHVSAISDPLPQIRDGIPLRLRRILVDLDRPGFALNPTNCAPSSIISQVFGSQGAVSTIANHFQVANCGSLKFSPRLSLRLTGGTNRRGHPAIHADFKAKPGQANPRVISVALPKGMLLDTAHIGNVCTRVEFAAAACPRSSVLGSATATTPLLDGPLKGKVYLRSSDRKLPDLVMDLEGQIDIALVGVVDSVNGGSLRTTFRTIPDVPVARFKLKLTGGKKGLLVNNSSLCGVRKRARTRFVGQNGAEIRKKITLKVRCKGKSRKGKRMRLFRASEVGK